MNVLKVSVMGTDVVPERDFLMFFTCLLLFILV